MRKPEVALFLAALLLSSSTCFAAPPTSAAKTREYHEAYAAYNANDAAKAYRILTALVAQNPAYDAVGLLGQTELMLQKYRDAAEHITYAIRNTPPGKAEGALPLLKEDLATAKTHVATLRVTVDQPDAEISVDRKVVGNSPIDFELFAEPGQRTVEAVHMSLGVAKSTIDVKAGEERNVTLKLGPVNGAAEPAPLKYKPEDLDKPSAISINPPPPVEDRHGMEPKTIVLVVGGAVTLVAAGTATYFGLKARSAKSEAEDFASKVEDKYGNNGCVTADGAASDLCTGIADSRNDQRDAGRIANISFAITGVAAIATGLTYLLWPRSKAPTSGFIVVPHASPTNCGLNLQGDF